MSWYLSTPRFGAWQSEASLANYLRTRGSWVQILPGAPNSDWETVSYKFPGTFGTATEPSG